MSRVRGKDTKPEMRVRRLTYRMGYSYRLHVAKLPGRPDLVFTSRRSVIFVHGCFWHRHENCPLARMPKSRTRFWTAKLNGNKERDGRKVAALTEAGWRRMVVWECELTDEAGLQSRLARFLGRPNARR